MTETATNHVGNALATYDEKGELHMLAYLASLRASDLQKTKTTRGQALSFPDVSRVNAQNGEYRFTLAPDQDEEVRPALLSANDLPVPSNPLEDRMASVFLQVDAAEQGREAEWRRMIADQLPGAKLPVHHYHLLHPVQRPGRHIWRTRSLETIGVELHNVEGAAALRCGEALLHLPRLAQSVRQHTAQDWRPRQPEEISPAAVAQLVDMLAEVMNTEGRVQSELIDEDFIARRSAEVVACLKFLGRG